MGAGAEVAFTMSHMRVHSRALSPASVMNLRKVLASHILHGAAKVTPPVCPASIVTASHFARKSILLSVVSPSPR